MFEREGIQSRFRGVHFLSVPGVRQTALKNNIFIAASDVLGNNAPAVISPQRN
jgi:hypothetical protein